MTTTTQRPLKTSGIIFQWRSLKTRVTLTTLAVFFIGIWSLAFYTSLMLREDMQRLLSNQQFSTVSLLAKEINQELDERLRALGKIAEQISPALMNNKAALQALLEQRPIFQILFNGGTFITRPDGTAIAEGPLSTGRLGLNYMASDHIAGALKEGKASIGRPLVGRALRAPVVGMAAPIRDPQGKVIGALVGVTNLGKPNFLDRVMENPYGKTGDYVIAAPQHRLIVTATNKSRAMEASPAPGLFPLIDRFMQGYEGTGMLVNPLGVEVLQSARGIPVAGWYVAAQLPTDEAFAPIRAMQRRMLMATIFLTLLAGSLTWWILKRQLEPALTTIKTLAAMADANQPPKSLPIKRQDEIGALIGGFNHLLESLGQREKALKKSEERHRSILQTAMDGIWRMDMQGRLLEVNEAYSRISGYSAQELLAMRIPDLEPNETADDAAAHIQKAVAQGEDRFESRYRRKDRGIIDVEVSIQYRPTDGGEFVGFLRDIAERKRMEEEKRQEQQKAERLAGEMGAIAEIGRVIGSTLDIDEVYDRFADEAKKLIPFDSLIVNLIKKEENELVITYVSGMEIPSRRKGDRLPFEGSITEMSAHSGKGIILQTENIQEIINKYPGRIAVYHAGLRSMLSVPLISEGKLFGALVFRSKAPNAYTEQDLRLAEKIGMQISGAIANARLYSDLRNIEKSLRISEERLSKLYQESPIPTFTWRKKGDDFILDDFNRAAIGSTNGKAGNYLGASAINLYKDSPQILEDLNFCFRERSSVRREITSRHFVPGRHLLVHYGFIPPDLIIVHVDDQTERKRAEEEKRSLEERLQRAEKMEALGQLAGGVAHDLNNVLGVTSIHSELLQENLPEGSPLRKSVNGILASTQKAADIIQDLLTLARRGVKTSEVINLNSIVSDFLKTSAFEKMKDYHPRVTFKTEYDKNLLNIKGSPVHLEKTVMNLVSNAAEAISGIGEVTIRTASRYIDKPVRNYDEVKEGDYAVLTVSDTGMGIPVESIEKIFEPFYTKKTMGRSGTGLGLAIVWGTVKDHNGYIDVQTEVDKGTTFTLYFPVTREELIAQQQKAPIEQYMGKGESVLVVDDVAEQRDVAARLLARLGYKVHAVSSGEEAVDYLKDNKADILVLDMIMAPGIDGLETYKRVLEINPKQKAILVSGFSETERVIEAQKLGAGAHVKKPYMMEKIGTAIRDGLQRVDESESFTDST